MTNILTDTNHVIDYKKIVGKENIVITTTNDELQIATKTSPIDKSIIHVAVDSQIDNLQNDAPIRYNSKIFSIGNSISYDFSNYTFTVSAGSTYRLHCSVTRIDASTNSPELVYQWFNLTKNLFIGSCGGIGMPDNRQFSFLGGIPYLYLEPNEDTKLQVRIKKNDSITSISSNNGLNGNYAIIETI